MFAVIKTGGKQYKVEEGDVLKVEKIDAESVKENKVELEDLFGGKKVTAALISEGKGKKVEVFKFHSKKRYKRQLGHRQLFSEIKIEKIV